MDFMKTIDLNKLNNKIKKFAKQRDWEIYHTPKNLSMALSVEVSELVEIFQWLTSEESYELKTNNNKMEQVRDEVADIFVYLIRICDILNIDLENAVNLKIEKNALKYPVDKARGNAKKYNEYLDDSNK
jgi:NTP pyrophosphatase (non-canonical NTP hydrolase)